MKQLPSRPATCRFPIVRTLLISSSFCIVLSSVGIYLTRLQSLLSTPSRSLDENHVVDEKVTRADKFVQETYNRTYRVLVHSCKDTQESERTCFARIQQEQQRFQRDNNSTRMKTFPWWFETILRDGQEGFLHGAWHNFSIANPSVGMCTIEKIASTQWRRVFWELNGGEFGAHHPPKDQPQPHPDAPRFVFLRDPLERFLSAYINKCVGKQRRRLEKHCEPNIVFNNPEAGLLRQLNQNKKVMFETYVDTMPLKWNMHFFPQALYCDGLFRHLDEYDFVGNMGPNFYKELDILGRTHGGRFEEKLEEVFDLRNHLERADVNEGLETAAPRHVEEYYNARTVRRVLEYLSIDYITLGLPIPDWAERMLEEER